MGLLSKMSDWVSGWVDTPKTVTTTRAPAVLKMWNIHVLHPRLGLGFGGWPLLIIILDEKADYDSSPYHFGKLETIITWDEQHL